MRLATALLALLLSGCGGIPLASMPKLIALQGKLLDADPGEFMVAVQADARLTPPPGSSPVMHLDLKPAREGTWPPVRKMLKMHLAGWSADLKGLKPAPANRRWLVYSFTPESQAELRRLQEEVRKHRGAGRSGTLSIGIAQEGLAVRNPELGNTRWESWLQSSRAEGFYELWSGTLGDLLTQAGRAL